MRAGMFLVLMICLSFIGCAEVPQRPQDTFRQIDSEPKVLPDRYELRDVRNGSFFGTALLDKQTGRVWTLGSSTNKEGKIDAVEFDQAPTYPNAQELARDDNTKPRQQSPNCFSHQRRC
jgi:hypothetical protein